MEGNITISKKEYYELRCDRLQLQMLENGGVDNWEGYHDSLYEYDGDFSDLCDEEFKRIEAL